MFKFWRRRKGTLRTQRLILENRDGEERARFDVDESDNVVLRFTDKLGKARLRVGLSSDGTPRIVLSYAGGRGSIQLEANDKLNSAALVIIGPSGKAQVLLGVARNGHPAIVLYDNQGKQVFPEKKAAGKNLKDDIDNFDWDEMLRELG